MNWSRNGRHFSLGGLMNKTNWAAVAAVTLLTLGAAAGPASARIHHLTSIPLPQDRSVTVPQTHPPMTDGPHHVQELVDDRQFYSTINPSQPGLPTPVYEGPVIYPADLKVDYSSYMAWDERDTMYWAGLRGALYTLNVPSQTILVNTRILGLSRVDSMALSCPGGPCSKTNYEDALTILGDGGKLVHHVVDPYGLTPVAPFTLVADLSGITSNALRHSHGIN